MTSDIASGRLDLDAIRDAALRPLPQVYRRDVLALVAEVERLRDENAALWDALGVLVDSLDATVKIQVRQGGKATCVAAYNQARALLDDQTETA